MRKIFLPKNGKQKFDIFRHDSTFAGKTSSKREENAAPDRKSSSPGQLCFYTCLGGLSTALGGFYHVFCQNTVATGGLVNENVGDRAN